MFLQRYSARRFLRQDFRLKVHISPVKNMLEESEFLKSANFFNKDIVNETKALRQDIENEIHKMRDAKVLPSYLERILYTLIQKIEYVQEAIQVYSTGGNPGVKGLDKNKRYFEGVKFILEPIELGELRDSKAVAAYVIGLDKEIARYTTYIEDAILNFTMGVNYQPPMVKQASKFEENIESLEKRSRASSGVLARVFFILHNWFNQSKLVFDTISDLTLIKETPYRWKYRDINLSMCGASLDVDFKIGLFERIELSICTSEEKWTGVTISGKVVRLTEEDGRYNIAVDFELADSNSISELRHFLERKEIDQAMKI